MLFVPNEQTNKNMNGRTNERTDELPTTKSNELPTTKSNEYTVNPEITPCKTQKISHEDMLFRPKQY